jgi:hypothetical protein
MKVGKVSGFTIVASVVFAWAGACSTSTTDGDSESHFLATCPPGCPSGLECICGACTRACVTDDACGSLGTNATCVEHATCGNPKTCDVKCNAASDCVTPGAVCDNGVCRRSVTQKDGGAGGGGGDGSTTTPNDVSTIPNPDGYVPPRIEAGPLPVCDQPVDTRSCEFGELFVHEPQTNACRSAGGFVCPNNDNGFISMAECLAACPGAHEDGDARPTSGRSPSLADWDGGPFFTEGGTLITCWFPRAVSWVSGGVLGDGHTLARPGYTRRSVDGRTCEASLPDCGQEGITPHDVGVRLRDPDVHAALLRTDSMFGKGGGTLITIDNVDILVGAPCEGATGCTDAPPGIARLRDLLKQVEAQELGRGSCRPNSDCYLAPDVGPCNGALPRFAYDPETGACKQFTYGGCAGNGNRFETKAACEDACDFDPCLLASTFIPPEAGDVDAGCRGTIVANRQLCAPDPMTACGCACSRAGHDASECRLSGASEASCQ